MLYRALHDVIDTAYDVDWGNGRSRRLVVAGDQCGFTVTDTIVQAGTETHIRFDRHVEACYCIEGVGYVQVGAAKYPLSPGVLYSPMQGEEHWLVATEQMRLVCVFNPPLRGDETHNLDSDGPSGY
jgi:L-ectoine synthase